jgi:hypothetical protein
MIKIASLSMAAALFACGLSAPPAQAGPQHTWVSGTRTDSGACTRTAPCRTFAFAITQTSAGGEIDVLDPAGYGPVTITKAISIVNDGVGVPAIGAPSSRAISINAGASNSVRLRGLTVDGFGSGDPGIFFASGGNLAIENWVIRGFAEGGIFISPSTSSSFSISNTIASNNGSAGITVLSGSGAVTGVLSRVITNNNKIINNIISVNGAGIFVGFLTGEGPINVTIVDSVASDNPVFGIGVGGVATVMVRNSVASNNKTGLEADGGVLRVAHSVVTGNNTGVRTTSGGTIKSYGDNDINGNTNDNFAALTTIPTH